MSTFTFPVVSKLGTRAFFCLCLSFLTVFSNQLTAQGKAQPALIQPNAPAGGDYDAWKLQQTLLVQPVVGSAAKAVKQQLPVENPGGLQKIACSSSFIPKDASYLPVPRSDDGSFGALMLDFNISVCGETYNSVFINTNGNVTFGQPYQNFGSEGFPHDVSMAAGFWADVDTRNPACGQIWYKMEAHHLIVTWEQVGYFSGWCNRVNTFQIIIADGQSAMAGFGNRIQFRYGDMQWTGGNAGGGYDGFYGKPALVGFNSGDGVHFLSEGGFSVPGGDFLGQFASNNGVDYLDGKCFSYSTGTDADGDGFSACAGDCNDGNASVFPGAPEICDLLDNNCDGEENDLTDADNDGFAAADCAGNVIDCQDDNYYVNPAAFDYCDLIDDNCDGVNNADNDGDGWVDCSDCDDNNPDVHYGVPDGCDGLDNDCEA